MPAMSLLDKRDDYIYHGASVIIVVEMFCCIIVPTR